MGLKMVFKTLIAATCAAVLAGSMVYFSTAPDGTGGSVKLKPVAAEEAQAEKLAQNDQKSSIIDRYINNQDSKDTLANENPYAASTVDDAKNDIEAVQPVTVQRPQNQKSIRKQSVQMKKLTSTDPAQMRIDVVFKEAKQIKQADLRDRAYLDLADYATNKGLFNQAEKAALKINQPELRDTARSRIAMGMARYGMADEAFALINKVEVKELQDVMRLQVIEALLGTDQIR